MKIQTRLDAIRAGFDLEYVESLYENNREYVVYRYGRYVNYSEMPDDIHEYYFEPEGSIIEEIK